MKEDKILGYFAELDECLADERLIIDRITEFCSKKEYGLLKKEFQSLMDNNRTYFRTLSFLMDAMREEAEKRERARKHQEVNGCIPEEKN